MGFSRGNGLHAVLDRQLNHIQAQVGVGDENEHLRVQGFQHLLRIQKLGNMFQVIGLADQIQGLLVDIAEAYNLIIVGIFQQPMNVNLSPDSKSHHRYGMLAHLSFLLP